MIKVTGPRLLVKPRKLEEVDEVYKMAKAAGIAMPEMDEFKREERAVVVGTLLQTTPLCWQAPVGDGTPWAKEGDTVIYARYAGKFIMDPTNSEEYLILNDEDIIGVIAND